MYNNSINKSQSCIYETKINKHITKILIYVKNISNIK